MATRAKAARLGRLTLIAAVSSKSSGTRALRRNEKQGLFRRSITLAPRGAARAAALARHLERAGMVAGAVMTGLELAREIRSAASKAVPPSRPSSWRPEVQSSSPSATDSRMRSSSRKKTSSSNGHSTSKSTLRKGNSPPRGARLAATKRSGPPATAKKRRSATSAKKHA